MNKTVHSLCNKEKQMRIVFGVHLIQMAIAQITQIAQ